jgi:hypothetical protein
VPCQKGAGALAVPQPRARVGGLATQRHPTSAVGRGKSICRCVDSVTRFRSVESTNSSHLPPRARLRDPGALSAGRGSPTPPGCASRSENKGETCGRAFRRGRRPAPSAPDPRRARFQRGAGLGPHPGVRAGPRIWGRPAVGRFGGVGDPRRARRTRAERAGPAPSGMHPRRARSRITLGCLAGKTRTREKRNALSDFNLATKEPHGPTEGRGMEVMRQLVNVDPCSRQKPGNQVNSCEEAMV